GSSCVCAARAETPTAAAPRAWPGHRGGRGRAHHIRSVAGRRRWRGYERRGRSHTGNARHSDRTYDDLAAEVQVVPQAQVHEHREEPDPDERVPDVGRLGERPAAELLD